MLYYNSEEKIVSEQVSFILGENYVLSFQEAEGDVFDSVRDRLRFSKGRIRGLGSDYLLYALIDAVTDHYYFIIETMGNKIEDLEDNLFNGQSKNEISQQIQDLKREVLKVRRAIFPLREIINRIEKTDNKLILDKTLHYYRDIYDHIIQISENIDIYREMIWGLMDMYMTSISNKMNEVMKVLTNQWLITVIHHHLQKLHLLSVSYQVLILYLLQTNQNGQDVRLLSWEEMQD